jgi:hypothetical protein
VELAPYLSCFVPPWRPLLIRASVRTIRWNHDEILVSIFRGFESTSCPASTETVIKILHVNPVPEVLEIWQAAAGEFGKAHPQVKVQFDYLDHELFKAKLPTLLKGPKRRSRIPSTKPLLWEVNHSGWICVAMDQLLGRETGRVFNDEALAVAAGIRSPEQATQTIENSWSKNRI